MYSLDFQQPQLEEQPFSNYIDSFYYMLRDRIVKIAILSYDYESGVPSWCYHISGISYLVLDECDRFLYSPEDLTDAEDENIQQSFCELCDYNPNEADIECLF